MIFLSKQKPKRQNLPHEVSMEDDAPGCRMSPSCGVKQLKFHLCETHMVMSTVSWMSWEKNETNSDRI